MTESKIKLGYELGSGEPVYLHPSHMIVTGLTQKAGKTTTLESLIKRSGKKAIVFRTKIGEKSFLQGTIIPPFFRDRSDWQFIQGLVEATIREKLRTFERAKIIQLCKESGGNHLLDFKKKVDERLAAPKINSFEKDILTNIQAYLEIVLPKLQTIRFSEELQLAEGLNIIDLERFSRDSEVQSLILRSVVEEVLYKFQDVIIVIPEAWKFIPQDRGNPCKLIIEEFIRQGATNGNYIWIDSQDMTGVDKTPLKQVTEWILGYQSEINEVKHTLDQIPLPKSIRPKPEDIMSLGTGIFYLATRDRTIKCYVQPFWLDDDRAQRIALGEIKITEIDAPLSPILQVASSPQPPQLINPGAELQETVRKLGRELTEISTGFLNKLALIQSQVDTLNADLNALRQAAPREIDEDVLIRKIVLKFSTTPAASPAIDKEALVREVLARIPKSPGTITYEVAPLEKIRKDFLAEARDKFLAEISGLDDSQKKMLKFIEQKGTNSTRAHILENCFGKSATGGSTYTNLAGKITDMKNVGLIRMDTASRIYPNLKERIAALIEQYGATQQEVDQVYNHILAEMLK